MKESVSLIPQREEFSEDIYILKPAEEKDPFRSWMLNADCKAAISVFSRNPLPPITSD